MDNKTAQLLKSTDIKQRQEGLKRLAHSDDPNDLNIIFEVFKRERDVETKALARKVGKHLQKKFAKDKQHIPKIKNDSQQSQTLLGQAEEALGNYDYSKGQSLVSQAFQLNPDLQYDEGAVQLASDVFGKSPSRAIQLALGIETAEERKRKRDIKRAYKENQEVGLTNAFLDILMMGGVAAILSFLGMLFIGLTVGNRAVSLMETGSSEVAVFIEFYLDYLLYINTTVAIFFGIYAFIATVVWLMIQSVSNHIAATMFMGGDGTWSGLIRRMRFPVLVSIIILIVVTTIGFYWLINAQLNYLTGTAVNFENYNNAFEIIQGIDAILSFAFLFWMSSAIGENYKYGMGRGCLTMFVASFVFMGFACCAAFVLPSMFS